MRLIDADAFWREMLHEGVWEGPDMERCWIRYGRFDTVLDEQPTVDAVEVVRCKDCEFYVTDGGALMICDITNCIVIDDDYCSYGKRKE